MTAKDEALKKALDDLILEYHMDTSSFAKRVDEIFEQALAAQPAPVKWSDYEPDGRRYPTVPDAFGTREGEHPQYIQGWNDCRAEMLKGMK